MSTSHFLHYLLFFNFIHAHIKQSTGINFIDDFTHFDGDIWKKEDDNIFCEGDCFYADETKIRYVPLPKLHRVSRTTELQIIMRNDCTGQRCCGRDGKCAVYSGGQLTSAHTYGYGSFRFLAMVAKNQDPDQHGLHDVYSCIALNAERVSIHTEYGMGISICIPSQDTKKALITWTYGDSKESERVNLGFDAAGEVVKYRLDWTPNQVMIWGKNRLLATSKYLQRMIPDQPMPLMLMIIPQPVDPTRSHEDQSSENMDVHYYMFIYKARYIKYDVHTELFANVEQSDSYSFTIILFFVAFILSYFVYFIWRKRKSFDETRSGDYFLLQDERNCCDVLEETKT